MSPEGKPADRSQITLPIADYIERDGSTARGRGIIVQHDFSDGMQLGFGLLSMTPKKSSLSPDPQLERSSRGSRKAAVRLTVKF
jgi:hypothetical protein